MQQHDFPGSPEDWACHIHALCSGKPPDPWWRSWLNGMRPLPYGDGIEKCAARLGKSAQWVAETAYGMPLDTIREWWLVESVMRARASYIKDTPRRRAKRAEWGRERRMFGGNKEAYHAHQRATLIANMTKAMAAQGKTLITPESKALRQIKNARYQLRNINQSLDRITRYLAHEAKRLSKPWHIAGFATKDAWVDATPEGAEHKRLEWQARTHARDARVNALPGTFSAQQWYALMNSFGYRCAYCGRHRSEFRDKATRTDLEIDHIYPIGHPWARNDESNIVPACKTCNTSKSDRDLLTWAKDKGLAIHPWAMQKYWAIHAANQESACQA
jgi:5-methylcytosine-specific restriction endonuclease McrA